MSIKNRCPMSLAACLFFLATIPVSHAQYSGGSGTADDPYQIATAADLIALGETPDDYDKHFVLTADIDLDPNLPGGKVFDRALIAPDTDDSDWRFDGTPFSGVFDGNGHTISHLTIVGGTYLGLFGHLGSAMVSDLGLQAVNVSGMGDYVGGLVGWNSGTITTSYSTGTVSADDDVGGLVGYNLGKIAMNYSSATVSARGCVGGLVGENFMEGSITSSYSAGVVVGVGYVGGLIGMNGGSIAASHSAASVSGVADVGGLVGDNEGGITTSCSRGAVIGNLAVGGLVGENAGSVSQSYAYGSSSGVYLVGGLVGCNYYHGEGGVPARSGIVTYCYSTGAVSGVEDVGGLVGDRSDGYGPIAITNSFWDMETSGQSRMCGENSYPNCNDSYGRTTAEMQTATTFLEAGWDFMGETENGPNEVWKIVEGQTYPLLSWQKYGGGTGEPNNPYLIYTAEHLNALGAEPNDYDKCFKLMADIDLSGYVYDRAVIAPDVNDFESGFQGASFVGVFDGNGHVISHLTIRGDSYLALFGELGWGQSEITNLGLEAVDVNGTGDYIGGLVGDNLGGYSIRSCCSTGIVSGNFRVGGLVGRNGNNDPFVRSWGIPGGTVTGSYSTGTVKGDWSIGGLVGENYGTVQNCYSLAVVTGVTTIGGLVGVNGYWYWDRECERWGIPSDDCLDIAIPGTISNSYSIGAVVGTGSTGGLVDGSNGYGPIIGSFWDIENSGQATSNGGTGLTTAEMQTASTFLDTGWDFVGETENGTDDIWWILEGQDYPRLWWELEEAESGR